MDALVVQIPVEEGASIAEGEILLILEAMKMEVAVAAPRPGTVIRIVAQAGVAVRKGQLLAELD
jgi:acetyl-CoA/propionyl-CoA carboxylase biotin carboxyl carrier protein